MWFDNIYNMTWGLNYYISHYKVIDKVLPGQP